MKKTLALLLCLAMLFTALSVNVFAETTENPSVTIVAHSASADTSDDSITNFAIKLEGFNSLKGIDMTVTTTDGIDLLSASALNFSDYNDNIIEIEKDTDYTISSDKHTLHIVGLQKEATGDIITVRAKVTGDATIDVTAKLAKSGKLLYDKINVTDATITAKVNPTTTDATSETVKQPTSADYFIPYGSVYTIVGEEYKYAKKDENGTFSDTNGAKVTTFKVPQDGFGTYGVSDSLTENAKQFGNYVKEVKANKDYGSIVITGHWEIFRDWYLSNKGYSDADLVKILYNRYLEKKNSGDTRNFIPFGVTIDGTQYIIKVFNVKQYNYLWKNGTSLEYGVRVKGLQSGSDYATIAYYAEENGSNAVFAKEIKTVKHTINVN